MQEKENTNEVAEVQPSENAVRHEKNMSNEAVMQMMKHLWPDTNDQRDKEYWRNLHKELIFHYEYELKNETDDYSELVSKSFTFARFAMNEIQAYERGDFKEMFQQK